ncbi:phosphotransferase [bacterium]|nr:phosphotransferase [bacterium]
MSIRIDDLVNVALTLGGAAGAVTSIKPLSGGCINAAWRITTVDGAFFLKTNPHCPDDMFEREFEGLEAIANVGIIRTPRPIAWGKSEDGQPAFLLTELIEKGPRVWNFSETFGGQFAQFHRAAVGERFGFAHDNYLGSTPQPNAWADNWTEFFREQRLVHQLGLAEANGYRGELQRLGHRLADSLERWIDEPEEPPTLLHGDLWSGNYLCTDDGDPCLIDPACYYGRREADLAMAQLFGGFDQRFYDAYEEEWPLEEGARARIDLYKLYHLLNHLNLFGGTYLSGCLEGLRRFV